MTNNYFLKQALLEAKKALKINEVPIGCVIVKENIIIARAYNKKEKEKQTTSHAEINAIKKACKKLNDWRLTNTVLYTTIEPCTMCAGAIIQARIKKVIFGAYEKKMGAAGSIINVFKNKQLNHQTEVEYHESTECINIISEFFKNLR